ncbi:hypothetical protein [Aliivibrio sifiae]|uniref:Uncharacterized protein n=1 Tax=Aliivibrio sifiae TaxID=566293 RepID=A0A2S7X779_9GAMM|nr:hypothetical protein [Aliivibrio sifiae]PQJ87200.1 hypothetical protein BTO23_13815 [Aliivibrio sifiae]GLR73659.1 hypothetical protein GCM10007855_05330 [Aliivibrio sifiae]
MEQFIDFLSKDIARKFSKSKLEGGFRYQNEHIELLIVIPETYPPALLSKLEKFVSNSSSNVKGELEQHNLYRCCPAIERIEIANSLQNKGLFSAIVSELLKVDFVQYVCIQRVGNPHLLNHLTHSKKWNWILSRSSTIGIDSIYPYCKSSPEMYRSLLVTINEYLELCTTTNFLEQFKLDLANSCENIRKISVEKNKITGIPGLEGIPELAGMAKVRLSERSIKYNMSEEEFLFKLALNTFYTTEESFLSSE